MKLIAIMGTFAVGLGVAVHLAMNGAAGAAVGNPRMANAVFWCVGAIVAVLLALTGYDAQVWPKAATVPAWLWTAGAAGACLVFSIAWLIPRLGAGTVNVTLLTGQVLGGLVIAHLGILGSPVERLNGPRLVGVAVMLAGGALAVLGRWPWKGATG